MVRRGGQLFVLPMEWIGMGWRRGSEPFAFRDDSTPVIAAGFGLWPTVAILFGISNREKHGEARLMI